MSGRQQGTSGRYAVPNGWQRVGNPPTLHKMRSSVKTVASPAGLPKIYAEVQFGSPKDACRGSGICRVFTTVGARRLKENPRRANVLIVMQDGGYPVFWINRKNLSMELLREVFHGPSFAMPEAFELGGSIAGALGKDTIYIPSGTYPIRSVQDWLLVDFSPQER